MSNSAAPPARGPARASGSTWLISPAVDVFGLVGSVAVSYALFFAWQGGLLEAVHLVPIWIFVFHGPHFFGTLTRTLLDRQAWNERGVVFLRSWLWFLVGPAIVGAGLLFGSRDLVMLFFFLAAAWAFHHVVKQHFGFVALFRARNRIFDRTDLRLTRYYLIFSLWAPVLILLTNHPHWLQQIPGVVSLAEVVGQDELWRSCERARGALTWGFWAAQVAFLATRLGVRLRGGRVLVMELALIAACVSLSWVVAQAALRSPDDPWAAYAIVPLITIFHNVQYHCLIWHYNRKKYRGEGAADRYGWASVFSSHLVAYFLGGVLYTAVTIGLESYGLPLFDRSTYTGEILVALLWGFSFQHYYLDGVIWKVSRDAELRRILSFA